MESIPEHAYSGAGALIALHQEHLTRFVATWRRAQEARVPLPQTEDPDYASLELLLCHVLGCARHYMLWCCEQLELAAPPIEATPDEAEVEEQLEAYLGHVLEAWRTPLQFVAPQRFKESFAARWGPSYCIDAMLEHAVMHPIRHSFQLERLMAREMG